MKSEYKNQKKEKKLESTDIRKILKGFTPLGYLFLMLLFAVKKIINIKEINASGWLMMVVIFVVASIMRVKLSEFLERITNIH